MCSLPPRQLHHQPIFFPYKVQILVDPLVTLGPQLDIELEQKIAKRKAQLCPCETEVRQQCVCSVAIERWTREGINCDDLLHSDTHPRAKSKWPDAIELVLSEARVGAEPAFGVEL